MELQLNPKTGCPVLAAAVKSTNFSGQQERRRSCIFLLGPGPKGENATHPTPKWAHNARVKQ